MTEQLSLLPALTCAVIREIEAPARAPFVPRARQVDFPFVPGPECEPRALDVVPEWLRFWIDEDVA